MREFLDSDVSEIESFGNSSRYESFAIDLESEEREHFAFHRLDNLNDRLYFRHSHFEFCCHGN